MKAFLCHSSVGNYRISTINDDTVVDIQTKREPYKPKVGHTRGRLLPENFYTLVVSSFSPGELLGGKLEILSNQPLQVRTIGAEGAGMQVENIPGAWTQANAGGCSNYPTYGKNPAWVVQFKGETEFFMRLAITA